MSSGPKTFGFDVNGPRLNVTIRNKRASESTSHGLEKEALIDTGASVVCIDPRIARKLQLRWVDQQSIGVLGSKVMADIYAGVLEIPELEYEKEVPLFAPVNGRLENPPILLGRSFLKDFILTFNGPSGMFHFAKPSDFYSGPVDDE